MLLSHLKVGRKAQLVGFSDSAIRHQSRYLSLGLMPGAEIKIIRTAPLGCPLEIKVGSTLISMRKAEAAEVLVEALS